VAADIDDDHPCPHCLYPQFGAQRAELIGASVGVLIGRVIRKNASNAPEPAQPTGSKTC